MQRPVGLALFFVGAAFVAACGNQYHPEYHPVTVTNVSGTYSNPVTVEGTARPVVVAPAPQAQQPGLLAPATPQPPPGFFEQ